MKSYDVAIIGAGIVGLAHAWAARRQNLSVAVFERTAKAEGASVRNFGMVWPIGQPAGRLYETALRSRELWLELGQNNVLQVESCGSIHLAHHPDEWELLNEFVDGNTHQTQMLDKDEVLSRSSIANPNGLVGGMYSPTELRVNPRVASASIAEWLAQEQGVDFYFSTPIVNLDSEQLYSSTGQTWSANRTLICSGSDLQTLYPDEFAQSSLVLCKLQMLKTAGQKQSMHKPEPHIASGLTLRHYTSFNHCHSLKGLKERIASESPELDQYGIHVMASTFPNGDIILGDSHEYGEDISPFDKTEIDQLMIRELQKVIALSDWTIVEKWHGIYAKHPELPVYQKAVNDQVGIFVGTGGAGMSLSFGLADQYWKQN